MFALLLYAGGAPPNSIGAGPYYSKGRDRDSYPIDLEPLPVQPPPCWQDRDPGGGPFYLLPPSRYNYNSGGPETIVLHGKR